MVLPDGWVLFKLELACPGIAKDQLYTALNLLGGLMLVLPDRLQDFQHIAYIKL